MTRVRFVALTIAVVIATAMLLALGAWQMQRLHWKRDLIARFEARAAAEPVALKAALNMFTGSTDDARFLRVHATGRYDHERELHLYALRKGEPGWHIVTPLQTADGQRVLVIRGFVPDRLKEPRTRAEGAPEGNVEVTGQVRYGETAGTFTPDNDPSANRWFWRDLTAMQQAAGAGQGTFMLPFFVELEAPDHAARWPEPHPFTAARLHNRHLGYAITWFGLAAALLAIYGVLVFRRRKA